MFQNLSEIAKEIRLELVDIYWVLLVPVVLLLIVGEMLNGGKNGSSGVEEIFRRVLFSIILLISFELVTKSIGYIGDGILIKLDKYNNSWEAFKKLGPNSEGSGSWFDIREYFLYAGALLSYVVAYLGFFMAEAITHFVWIILYICSPLMILCYVPRATANITGALYKGLVKVVVWKCLWTILGALLLKLALNPQGTGMEDYLFSMVLNLCIGISMLFIPIATKSIINDGLDSAASAMAMVPAAGTASYIKNKIKKSSASGVKRIGRSVSFAAKPVTNPVSKRYRQISEKANKAAEKYKKINS